MRLWEFPLRSDWSAGGKSAAGCRSQVTFYRNLRCQGPRLYYSYLCVGLFSFYFLKLPISEEYVSPMECFNKPSCVFSQLSDENDLTALIPFARRLSQVSPTLVRHWNFFFHNAETWFIVIGENWPRVPKMKFKLRQRTLWAERLILHPLLKPEDMNFSLWPYILTPDRQLKGHSSLAFCDSALVCADLWKKRSSSQQGLLPLAYMTYASFVLITHNLDIPLCGIVCHPDFTLGFWEVACHLATPFRGKGGGGGWGRPSWWPARRIEWPWEPGGGVEWGRSSDSSHHWWASVKQVLPYHGGKCTK